MSEVQDGNTVAHQQRNLKDLTLEPILFGSAYISSERGIIRSVFTTRSHSAVFQLLWLADRISTRIF